MYTFQEVHEHTAGMGDASNLTYWKVVHEDTLLWIRYYSLGKLPEGILPWEFNTWVELTDEQRKEAFKMKKYTENKAVHGTKLSITDFAKAKEALFAGQFVSLGNCTATTPCKEYIPFGYVPREVVQQKQGNNPMGYNLATATTITSPSQSDESLQRGYLLQMLSDYNRYSWKDDSKYAELKKLFNIDAPSRPRTTQGILDAIKNGKFTLDQKKLDAQQKWNDAGRESWIEYENEDFEGNGNDSPYDTFYGMIFTDIPKEDRKGYEAAVKAYDLLTEQTKRKIIIGTPAEGLAALEALEAWLPTGKAN